MDLNDLRKEYAGHVLDVDTVAPNAFNQLESWFQEAAKAELLEPNAMVLSTSNLDGQPSQRSVLLKYFDKKGFVFFTNYGSRKATQIRDNPNVAVLFPWFQLQRQVEINGVAEKISQAEITSGANSSSSKLAAMMAFRRWRGVSASRSSERTLSRNMV